MYILQGVVNDAAHFGRDDLEAGARKAMEVEIDRAPAEAQAVPLVQLYLAGAGSLRTMRRQ